MSAVLVRVDDDDREHAPGKPWAAVIVEGPETTETGVGATMADALRDLADALDRETADAAYREVDAHRCWARGEHLIGTRHPRSECPVEASA